MDGCSSDARVRHAHRLALDVLEAYSEAWTAADCFQERKRRRNRQLYGDRFIRWMYELEKRNKELRQALDEVEQEFTKAAGSVVERGRYSSTSAHSLVWEVAELATSWVSRAVVAQLSPEYFRPGVETILPDLPASVANFREALSAAVKAISENEYPFTSDDVNWLSDSIEHEMARVVAANTNGETDHHQIEWTRPTFYKVIAEDVGPVSHNTLKGMLTEGTKPVAGKIRYRKASPTARKIQVAIADLPAKMQAKYRPNV